MCEHKKKRILEARNNFINELIKIIIGENGINDIGDILHPMKVRLEPINLPYNLRRKESSFLKEELYNLISKSHNNVNIDFGVYGLFNTLSICDFKSNNAVLSSLES